MVVTFMAPLTDLPWAGVGITLMFFGTGRELAAIPGVPLPVPKNISVMPTPALGRSVRGAIKVTTISSTRTRGAGNKLLIVDDEAARTRQLEFNL